MKTKITSIALAVLAALFTSTAKSNAGPEHPNITVTYNNSGLTSDSQYTSAITRTDPLMYSTINSDISSYSAINIYFANITNANERVDVYVWDILGNLGSEEYSVAANSTALITLTRNSYSTPLREVGLSLNPRDGGGLQYKIGGDTVAPTVVPEPSTYGLIGIGALGVAFAARRRKAKVA
jgi:hypothetical protein